MEIWNAFLVGDAHTGKIRCDILGIVNDGIAWALGTGNVFAQNVFVHKIVQIAQSRIFSTCGEGCPTF